MDRSLKVKRIISILLVLLLLCSVIANLYLLKELHDYKLYEQEQLYNINFPDANSRDTYYSIHNLKEAQNISKGAGIKVGILDWCFGFDEHGELYTGGKDFSVYEYHDSVFKHVSEHGFWMAQTLKEIAPEVEIYALGTYTPDDEDKWIDAMIEAINWAMENDIDILTLSHQAISNKNRVRFDEIVNKAIEQGIVTTFIHYDNPNNILPFGIWSEEKNFDYKRKSDINILQYDYNTFLIDYYKQALKDKEFNSTYKSNVYLSISSMSVVSAGFIAILKEINNTLTPEQYKEILIKTSRPLEYENDKAEHVVDIGKAVQYLIENY